MNNDSLLILWTNADPVTAEMMVFMYARNSVKNGWWKHVKIVIWGATAQLVAEDSHIQHLIKEAKEIGVEFSCCITCAQQLGVKDKLIDLDLEVIRWGEPLTTFIKNDGRVLSI